MKYESWSVRQLKKRKGNPWQARLKYKDPTTGKWKETSKVLKDAKGIREAKKLAEAWFDEMNEVAANSPNIEKDKTVGEMIQNYLDYQLRAGLLERSTYSQQQLNLRAHIQPYIGDYSFVTFDRNAVNIWLTKLNAAGLAQSTIAISFYTVRKVFNYYYDIGELNRNPFAGVKAPKKGDSKVTHLTKEQMDDYLTAVYSDYDPKDKFFAASLIIFYAGLRRGEMCGLRWRDVDLNTGTLSVETAIGIEMNEKGKRNQATYTKQPKNRSSIRNFQMVPQLQEALKQRAQAINPEGNWFVCGEKTDYYNPYTFSNDFKKFVKAHNLVDAYGAPLTPHMLRHNLGAVGIRSGMDIASLSRMFGHSSRAMTLDTYGDATKDAMIVAASKLGNTFDDNTEFFKMDIPEEEKED